MHSLARQPGRWLGQGGALHCGFAAVAVVALGVMYRPLLFASVDAEIADARGVLILPAAAAQQLTAQPSRAMLLAVTLATTYVWAGLVVGFYLPYPPSFFITAFAFLTFVGVRVARSMV